MSENIDSLLKRLDEITQGEIEFDFYYHTLSTNIPFWDDEFLRCIDTTKYKEVFPAFIFKPVVYDYFCEESMSNEKAEELHFSGIEEEKLTQENIEKFCTLFAQSFQQYKSLD